MKKILCLLLFTLLTISGLQAQTIKIKQVDASGSSPVVSSVNIKNKADFLDNHPLITTMQRLGAAASTVAKIDVHGNNNITKIEQYGGAGNVGAIKVNGNRNDISLTQNGSNLFSVIRVIGNKNTFNMNQIGTGLRNYIKLSGNRMQFNAKQTAAGMTLTQIGGSGVPLTVTTTGGMVPIIISN